MRCSLTQFPLMQFSLTQHPLTQFPLTQFFSCTVMIEDVEALTQSQMKPRNKLDTGFDWEDYQGHDEINAFIDGLASSNSEWISIKNIGKY